MAFGSKLSRPLVEVDELVTDRLKLAAAVLVEIRAASGLSRRELGRRSGVDERTIRRIESGLAARVPTYLALAIALGLPHDWHVRPDRLAEPADREAADLALIDDAADLLASTGRFGPDGLALLRAYAVLVTVERTGLAVAEMYARRTLRDILSALGDAAARSHLE